MRRETLDITAMRRCFKQNSAPAAAIFATNMTMIFEEASRYGRGALFIVVSTHLVYDAHYRQRAAGYIPAPLLITATAPDADIRYRRLRIAHY